MNADARKVSLPGVGERHNGCMRVVLTLLCVLATALPAWAQAAGQTTPAPAEQTAATSPAPVDPSKMGISLDRIVKGLHFEEMREKRTDSPLRLEFQVQVFGAAPRIDVLQGYDISASSPLPYGAPTHQDFISHWTPQAFKSPAMDISSLAVWAIGQLTQRSAKSQCEAEIAEYRELVMQGVAVSAPRCTQ